MNKLVQFILLACMFSSSAMYSSMVICEEPVSGYEGRAGKDYAFKVRMTCELRGSKLKLSNLKDTYYKELQTNSAYSVLSIVGNFQPNIK